MSQRYNDNIKRPKPQDTELGILQLFTHFARNLTDVLH